MLSCWLGGVHPTAVAISVQMGLRLGGELGRDCRGLWRARRVAGWAGEKARVGVPRQPGRRYFFNRSFQALCE